MSFSASDTAAAVGAGPAGQPAATQPPAGGGARWLWVYLAVLVVTLISHLPEFSGWVTCNPIYSNYGLVAVSPLHLLGGGCSMDGNDGGTLQALGGRAAEMWLRGSLPWWNSLAGLGLPLAAEAQPAAFFLPFVLLLHFYSGIVILKLVMQLLAGAFIVALFRELGLGRAAACVGAILFSLNGSFAWFAHSPILPIPFLPALLFGLERCRTRAVAGRPGGSLWVALALAYSIVAGFPETAFMDGLLAAIWAIVAFVRTGAARRPGLVTKIFAGGCVGMALSAPAWISFADYLQIASTGIHAFAAQSSLPVGQAAALLLPTLYGPPYADRNAGSWAGDGGYFGSGLALLALLAMFSGRRLAALRWAMAGWIAFWLCAFFRVPLAHTIWTSIKPLNEVGVTRYAMPSLECAAVVLAALAIDDWCRARQGLRTMWAACLFATLTAVTLLVAAVERRLPPPPGAGQIYLVATLLEAAAVVLAIAWCMTRPPSRRGALAVAALVAIEATGQFMLPEFAGTLPNRLALAPIAYLREHAGLSRVYTLHEQLPINYGSWLGVASMQADSLPFANEWQLAAEAIGGDINDEVTGWTMTPASELASFRASINGLRAAGTRYVIVAAGADPFVARPEPGMNGVYGDGNAHIYELAGAAPYFETSGGSCQVSTFSRLHVRTQCAAPALLLRRELRLPGWRATINGGKAPIQPGNGANYFQQVALPAGQGDIRWRYAPPDADLIAWLFAFGVFGAGMLAAASACRGARDTSPAGPGGRLRSAASFF
ncbi:MAG TPA: hypothetical protein VMB71_05820 [Acetobacteraceae bacterium]|nr:hypothetical protein [Acetobacteraceae bacterium]